MAARRGGKKTRAAVPELEPAVAPESLAIAAQSSQQVPLFSVDVGGQDAQVPPDRLEARAATPSRASGATPDFDLHALALASVRGVGVQVLRGLIDHYGDLRLIWDDDTPSIRDALALAKARESASIATHIASHRNQLLDSAAELRAKFLAAGIRLLSSDDIDFPDRLRDIPDGPRWLFVEGNATLLNGPPLLGIVGTRDPSRIGKTATKRLTSLIARQGLGIVSGLAEGIDATAHTMGLYFRAPQVAVLGTGINMIFPASTGTIRQRILSDGGVVITEYFPDDTYDGSRFVQRNRIQAGLAVAVIPVESRIKSGTAHTVRFAERYKRPLMGVYAGTLAPHNEIVGLLRDRGHPVFDLERTEEVEGMLTFLRNLIGDQWPEEPEPPNPRWLFRHAIKALDDVEVDIPLTERDKRWLIDYLAERYNIPHRRPERDRDS